MRQLGGIPRLGKCRIAPPVYAYQQAVRRQISTSQVRRTNWRHRTCFQSRFNLPNITVDIRPAGPCRLGIALPGRFTVTFDLAPPPFGAFLPSAKPPNRSLTSSDCFAASAAAFFLASAAAFGCRSFLGRRFLLCLGGGLLLGFRCGFSQLQQPLSPRPLRLFSAAAAAAFFASSACFLAAAAAAASFLASASAFFCASACALATFPLRPSPWRRRLRRPSVAL